MLLSLLCGNLAIEEGQVVPVRSTLAPVEDTVLERSAKDENFGREPVLVGGKDKVVLIRFPELGYRTGLAGAKNARIVFSLTRDAAPGELRVSRVKVPWWEGSGRSIKFAPPDARFRGGATWEQSFSGKTGRKWDSGGAGGNGDSSVTTLAKVEQKDNQLIVSGIDKLVNEAIQRPWANHGWRLEFSSEVAVFSGETTEARPRIEFEPVDEPGPCPDLGLVSLEPALPRPSAGGPVTWRAVVKNVGTGTSGPYRVVFVDAEGTAHEGVGAKALGVGEVGVVTFASTWRTDPIDPRAVRVTAEVVMAGDVRTRNNGLTVFPGGTAVCIEGISSPPSGVSGRDVVLDLQERLAELNDRVLAGSRYLSAQEGCRERTRLVLDPLGADVRLTLSDQTAGANQAGIVQILARSLTAFGPRFAVPPSNAAPFDPWPRATVGWLPDTRDDGLLLPGLEIPDLYWPSRENVSLPLWENGLLSRSEVAWIHARLGGEDPAKLWDAVDIGLLVRATDVTGEPLPECDLELRRWDGAGLPEAPLATAKVGRNGLAFFTALRGAGGKAVPYTAGTKMDGSNAWFLVRAVRAGSSASAWLPVTSILDWHTRGSNGTPSIELRFNIPSATLDLGQNLAAGRPVTDSQGRFPAELVTLTDNDPTTGVDVFPGTWVEVDIGRDRSFGMVGLDTLGAPFQSVEIKTYRTAQDPKTSLTWFRDTSQGFLARVLSSVSGGVTSLPYTAKATQSRYVRVINTGTTKTTLTRIRIVPIKVGA